MCLKDGAGEVSDDGCGAGAAGAGELNERGRLCVVDGDVSAALKVGLNDDDAGDVHLAAFCVGSADTNGAEDVEGTAHVGVAGGDEVHLDGAGDGAEVAADVESAVDDESAGADDAGGAGERDVSIN